MLRKFLLTIAYDGTNFVGWQRQALPNANNRSVQGALEKALKVLFKHPVTLRGAGRTDSGVHAIGQTAAFEVNTTIPASGIKLALNGFLPADVRISDCIEVSLNFHPRYDAVAKTYCYLISIGKDATAFNYNRSYFSKHPLNFEAMANAAKIFEGVHNFESFTAKGTVVRSYEKQILECSFNKLPAPTNLLPWQDVGECWQLKVTGSGFLYKMVRLMMGSLIGVGRGKTTAAQITKALAEPGKIIAPTAPACGLYLQEVYYKPESFQI